MADKDFEIALDKHLKREELLFRAKHCPNGSCVDWLAPNCVSVEAIVDELRWLGLRIKEIVDDDGTDEVDEMHFVVTTSGVVVFVNADCVRGLVTGRKR